MATENAFNARVIACGVVIVYAAMGFAAYYKTHASKEVPITAPDTILMISTTVDCAKAHSDADRLICHDHELAYDENRVEGTLSAAKAAAEDKDDFRLTVATDWDDREECHDKPCLVAWYSREIDWIDHVESTGQVEY